MGKEYKQIRLTHLISHKICKVEFFGNREVIIHTDSNIYVMHHKDCYTNNCTADVFIDPIDPIEDRIYSTPVTRVSENHTAYSSVYRIRTYDNTDLIIRWKGGRNYSRINIRIMLISKKLYEIGKQVYERYPEIFFDKDYKNKTGNIMLSEQSNN